MTPEEFNNLTLGSKIKFTDSKGVVHCITLNKINMFNVKSIKGADESGQQFAVFGLNKILACELCP